MTETSTSIYKPLKNFIENSLKEFDLIPDSRKQILQALADFVISQLKAQKRAKLVFICTHNSRRSHIAQILAQLTAYHYNIENVLTYSGGTEATAFNPRAVKAMEQIGFKIANAKPGSNPAYEVYFARNTAPLEVYSKVYDATVNPKLDFCAVMTCSHADENCPFIPGAAIRIALTYDDPKDFDDTPQEEAKYLERIHQIGRELIYAFSLVQPSTSV